MTISKKLETIYHNGQPDGIRSIRRNLSTMTTYVIPRPLLSEAKSISGITRPGIYYLINESDDNRIAQIYIGQTRNGINRLDDHNRSKDFYVNKLGFSVIRENYRPERNDWKSDLQCGNIELEIFGVSNPPARVSHPEAAKM